MEYAYPLGLTAVLGAVDGAARKWDRAASALANHIRDAGHSVPPGPPAVTPLQSQVAVWAELLMLGAGGLAWHFEASPDWWEPAVVGSLFALSQRVGANLSKAAGADFIP